MQGRQTRETDEPDESEQLHRIVDRTLKPFGKTSPRLGFGLLGPPAPLDISKPNEHDNKAEFQREKEAIEATRQHVDALFQILVPDKADPEKMELSKRFYPILTSKLQSVVASHPIDGVTGLIRRNIAEFGAMPSILWLLMDLSEALKMRAVELQDQEEKFWNVSNRGPDYHARAVALRLAKLYARETGQRPTFGASGITGDPSTTYSRALRDIFKIAGIKGRVRTYAEWAVHQLKDGDLRPAKDVLGGILGTPPPGSEPNAMAQVLREQRRKGSRS